MTEKSSPLPFWFPKRLLTPAALLLLLPCILFWQVFAGKCLLPAELLKDVYPWRTGSPKDLVPWNVLQFDGIAQFYPWRLFAAQTWRSGYVPLWNPHQFCGTPFLANGQSAVLYPPNLLYVLMPVKYAFGWSDLLHLALSGIAAYLFFRRCGNTGRWAATIGAACWQLSNWQISWIALPTFLDTAAWLPLCLLAAWRLCRKLTFTRAAFLAVVIALMILAGHLQMAFYNLLITLAFSIYLIIKDRLNLKQTAKYAVAVASLVILLTAAQILPTVELSRQSPRSVSTASAAGYAAYISLAMPVEQLAGLFIPGFFGHPEQGTYWEPTPYPENACYVGVFGLVLALIAILRRNPGKQRLFFLGVAAFTLLIALGTPLNLLLYYGIPGFASTGSPARILVLWTFCLAFLAAQGADDAMRSAKGIWAGAAVYVGASVLTCGLVLLELLHRDSGYASFAATDLRLFAGLLLAALAVLWLYSNKTIPSRAIGPVIFSVLAVDLLFINFDSNELVSPADVYPVTPSIAYLMKHSGYDRIMPLNSNWNEVDPPTAVLPPNAATVYGLYDLQGYDSLQTKSYKQFANQLDGHDSSPVENGNMLFVNNPNSPDADLADAKYLISLTPLSGFGEPVVTDGKVLVYLNKSAKPWWGPATLKSISATRADLSYNSPFDIAMQWYLGWRDTSSVWHQNGEFETGVDEFGWADTQQGSPFIHELNPLNTEIELSFQPPSFEVGLYLTLVGIAVLAARFRLRRLRQP